MKARTVERDSLQLSLGIGVGCLPDSHSSAV